MKRLTVCILFCMAFCLLVLPLEAQHKDHEGIFAYAFNPSGKYATDEAIPTHKVETAYRVFNDLVAAKGVRNMLKPTLVIQNAERRPAWTKPKEALVVLEEKAYDISMEMGADSLNALAALLGHELIHYYEKHDWKDHFLAKNKFLNTKDSDDENQDLEFQADHLGGLLAHIAGYKTLGILPSLLSKIYEAYGLDSIKHEGYPSLEERRAVAQKSDLLLTENSRLFDMSVYLTATGEYQLAYDYLNFLLLDTKFQSREIYNNLGALEILLAIDQFSALELPYFFPIEIEMESRISTRAGDNTKINELLDEAAYNLKNAIILDDMYAEAHMNLSIVYALREQWIDASYYIQKAEALYPNDGAGRSNCQVMHGLVAAIQGESDKARQYFINADSDLGRRNLCILNSRDNCTPIAEKTNHYFPVIDGVDLNQLFSRIMQNKEQATITIDLDLNNSFYTVAKDHTEVLVHLNHRDLGEYVFFQIATDPDLEYAHGIAIGSSLQEINEYLGEPSSIIQSGNRRILVFRKEQIVFVLDEKDTIIEWCLFKSTTS